MRHAAAVRDAAAGQELANALRAYLLEGYDPGESLSRLNRLVGSTESRSFATVFCLWFSPRTGRLRYASAGHPSPLLIRGDDVAFPIPLEEANNPEYTDTGCVTTAP